MRVLLVNVPYRDVYGSISVASGQYFPLGLGYIAARLKQLGHDVLLLDPEAQSAPPAAVRAAAAGFNPGVIGLNATTPTFGAARRMAAFFKSIPEIKDARVVLGGVHPTALKHRVLADAPEIDFAVFGEGEQTLAELLERLDGEAAWKDVRGLCHRAGGGNIVNQPREAVQDLDSLPFPDRSQVDLSRYRPNIYFDIGQDTATLITSRGCPYDCAFCSTNLILGTRFRAHSAEYVMSEIESINSQHKTTHFLFHDDTLTVNKKRAFSLFDKLAAHKHRLKWSCFAHLQTVDADILAAMKKSGCVTIGFGIESADGAVKRNLGKTHTNEQALEVFRECRKIGIRTLGFFIIGGPGETRETAIKTIALAKKLNPAFPIFNLLTPFPGTAIFDRYCKSTEEFDYDWSKFVTADFTCSFEAEIFKEKPTLLGRRELQTLLRKAAMACYLRPAYVFNLLSTMPGPGYINVLARGAFGFANYILSAFRGTEERQETK